MICLNAFLRDFFRLAHAHQAAGQAGDGRAFELRIQQHLLMVGIRPVQALSGVRSLGSHSLSGLYHQIDATAQTRQAVILGEWKSYRGPIPKNELLRFKAVTDDLWLQQHRFAIAPVIRVFGGTGQVTTALRRYAAQWGICLVTPDRWPALLLASEYTAYPAMAPDQLARRHLAWLGRPLHSVCAPVGRAGWAVAAPPPQPVVDHFLALQDYWSNQLWRRFRSRPGSFERWVSEVAPIVRMK